MSDALGVPDALTLLRHRAWVRTLARRLLADENAVDDVEQETWTAALRSGPGEPRALRSWLGSVASRFALQRLRGERRRARREEVVAAATARAESRPTADVVAEADAHGHVVQAVLALDEPYRTTVILRWFEGLSIGDVAARMEVPVETVRTRLRRAHGALRGVLRREHGRALALLAAPVAEFVDPACGAGLGGIVMAASAKTVTASVLAGALFGALVTAGAMTAGGGSLTDDPASDTASAGAGGSSPDSGRGGESEVAVEPARPERRGAAADAATAVPERTVQALLDAIDLTLPTPGTGTITGHVLTKEGAPVEGAVVRAWPQRPAGPSNPSIRRGRIPPRPTVESSVEAQLSWAKWQVGTMREAETDGAGAYTLREVFEMPHTVSAWAEGHDVRATPKAETSNARAGAVVDFVASAIFDVTVHVVDSAGNRPETATVRWSVPKRGGGGAATWRSSDPVVQVAAGAWEMVAVHEERGREARSLPVPVTVGPGVPNGPVTLRLVQRNVLEGAVRLDPADVGWEYVHVTLHRATDAGDQHDQRKGARPPDWGFRFEDVEPGEYELTASIDGISVIATTLVRIDGGMQRQDLAVPRLPATVCLEAAVSGPDGSPKDPGDVSFALRGTASQQSLSYGSNASRRPDGTFLVPLQVRTDALRSMQRRMAGSQAEAAEGAATGGAGGGGGGTGLTDEQIEQILRQEAALQWQLVVTWKGRGTKEVPFVPGETRRVEVRFD